VQKAAHLITQLPLPGPSFPTAARPKEIKVKYAQKTLAAFQMAAPPDGGQN